MDRPVDSATNETRRNNFNAEAFQIAAGLGKNHRTLSAKLHSRMEIASGTEGNENAIFTQTEMNDPAIQKILKTVDKSERFRMLTSLVLVYLEGGDLAALERSMSGTQLSGEFKADLLRIACRTKQPDIALYLIQHGALINSQDQAGETALHLACKMEMENVVERLLQLNANCNVQSKDGYTPLHNAVISGNLPILRMLLRRQPNLNIQDTLGQTPLHYVTFQGNGEMASLLLAGGARTDITDIGGRTVMHYAVINRKPVMVGILRDAQASYNAKDAYGVTPLMCAVFQKDFEMVSLLLREGALVNILDNLGRTALHHAAMTRNLQLVKALVLAGSDCNAKDQFGQTPLHYAVLAKDIETMRFLLANGANPNIPNSKGETSLHSSIATGDAACMNLLLDRGADPNYIDHLGCTPLTDAKMSHQFLLAAALIRRGADDDLEKELRQRKILAHVHGLKGNSRIKRKDGQEFVFKLGGFPDQISGQKLANSFDTFCKVYEKDEDMQDKKMLDEIGVTLNTPVLGSGFIPGKEKERRDFAHIAAEKVRKGEALLVAGGTMGHTIYIVFCKDRIIVCNRGARFQEQGGAAKQLSDTEKAMVDAGVVYEFPHGAVTDEMMLSFTKHDYTLQQFHDLFVKLKLKPPTLEDLEITADFKLKAQEAETCTWASSKTALLALLREHCGHTKEGHAKAYRIYKKYTEFVRKDTLATYLASPRHQGTDPEQIDVVKQIREKEKVKRERKKT